MAPTQPFKISADGKYMSMAEAEQAANNAMQPPTKAKKHVHFPASEADLEKHHNALPIRIKGGQRKVNIETRSMPYRTKAMSTRTGMSATGSMAGSVGLPYRTKLQLAGIPEVRPLRERANGLGGGQPLTFEALQQLDAQARHPVMGGDDREGMEVGEDDESSDAPTERPGEQQLQRQQAFSRATSYVTSVTQAPPTVTTALPPDDPAILAAAMDWTLPNKGGADGHREWQTPMHVRQKVSLDIIEKHWGGPLVEILPGLVRPLSARSTYEPYGGNRTLIHPMDWDPRLVKQLRKCAPRCAVKEFILRMQGSLYVEVEGKGLVHRGLEERDVRAYVAELKAKGRPVRTLADVERNGPAVEVPGAGGVPIPQWEGPLGKLRPAGTTAEFKCDGCTTVYENKVCLTCEDCKKKGTTITWCEACSHDHYKHEKQHRIEQGWERSAMKYRQEAEKKSAKLAKKRGAAGL